MQSISRISIENEIKQLSDKSWLTPSQACLFDAVTPFIGGIERVLNIYGPQGGGKTLIAHILFKANLTAYVTSLDQMCKSSLPLVIDNAPFERTEVRGIRNQMRKYGLQQVILISRYRAEDAIPSFGLNLNLDDIRFFRATLFRLFDLHLPEATSLSLWDHLKLIGDTND